MWRNTLFGLELIFLLAGCSRKDATSDNMLQFPETEHAEWIVSETDELVPRPIALCSTDSSVFVLGLMDGKWVHEYSLENGKLLGSRVSHGQGPGEVVNAADLCMTKNGFDVYDTDTKRIIEFDDNFQFVSSYPIQADNSAVWEAWRLSDKTALLRGPRFIDDEIITRSLHIVGLNNSDKNGMIFSYGDIAPAVESCPQALALQSVSILSPDRRHFATATTIGGVMEIFDISDDSIAPVLCQYLFNVDFDGQSSYVPDQTQYGFSAITVDNNYLYGAYSGTSDPNGMTRIGVWKWDGTPVKLIETDNLILGMTLTPASKMLVAVIFAGNEFRLAKIKLK